MKHSQGTLGDEGLHVLRVGAEGLVEQLEGLGVLPPLEVRHALSHVPVRPAAQLRLPQLRELRRWRELAPV